MEAWKHGVKISMIQNCFLTSSVKVQGPFQPVDINQAEEVEEEIYDCMRVANPRFELSNTIIHERFIQPDEKLVQDSFDNLENQILTSYQPLPPEEPPYTVQPSSTFSVTANDALISIEHIILYSLRAEPTPHIKALHEILQ